MCVKPITISNFNKGLPDAVKLRFPFIQDYRYVQVPCGKCPECLYRKQGYLIQRCVMMQEDYYIFFATLTYNNESLSYVDINGYRHYYAPVRDIQLFFKLLRKHDVFGGPFKYIACSEYGCKHHRPHWHVLFFVPKPEFRSVRDELLFVNNIEHEVKPYVIKYWSKNVGTKWHPEYRGNCTYINDYRGTTLDFHYVKPHIDNKSTEDVCYYVFKYVLKFDDWFEKKRQALRLNLEYVDFVKYYNMIKPRFLISKGFGITPKTKDYIRYCIDSSFNYPDKGYFVFINPISGRISPLSPYYRQKYLTVEDLTKMYLFQKKYDIDHNIYNVLQDIRPVVDNVYSDYEARKRHIAYKSFDNDFDF